MNEIEKGRAVINRCVGRYLQAHPTRTYEQVATKLGVSRWRVLMVASSLGVSRKTGPKPKRASKAQLPTMPPNRLLKNRVSAL